MLKGLIKGFKIINTAKIKAKPNYSCKLKLSNRKTGGVEEAEEQIWSMT